MIRIQSEALRGCREKIRVRLAKSAFETSRIDAAACCGPRIGCCGTQAMIVRHLLLRAHAAAAAATAARNSRLRGRLFPLSEHSPGGPASRPFHNLILLPAARFWLFISSRLPEAYPPDQCLPATRVQLRSRTLASRIGVASSLKSTVIAEEPLLM